MATYALAYTPIDIPASDPFPSGLKIFRPLVTTRLIAPSTRSGLKCMSCADSGADYCMFPLSFAAAIGFDPLKMKNNLTTGVGGGGNQTYYETVEIDVLIPGGPTLTFATYAGFTPAMEHIGLGLLGQLGFFETFRVAFNHRAREFTIRN